MPVINARSIDEALDALAARPGAMVLAGGTDAMVEINMGHRRADDVVAVGRVAELRSWSHDPASRRVHIGAAVPYAELLMAPLATMLPALAQASRTVGSPQIRAAGTLGGNLATCSPAGDTLPVLAALEAEVHLRSAHGQRTLPIASFMVGVKRTALQPGELITGVTVPVLEGWQGYSKVGVRNAMVIATATACLAVDAPTRSIRLALGSVAPTIVRCTDAEQVAMDGVDFAAASASDNVIERFGQLAAAASRPIDDHRSTAVYRRHAVAVMAARLLRRAFPRGGEGASPDD